MKYCLIGEKLGHSYSEIIHKARGLDYELRPIPRDKVKDFCLSGEYDGFNVTIPYKKEVIPYLDAVSSIAQRAGAVNTVTYRDGKLYGDNTDVDGMKYMLSRKGVSLKGKHILILGSGGTSNTARALAEREGASKVTVVSRTGEVNYSNVKELAREIEVIINATPVGMYPNSGQTPINLDGFDSLEGVFDCIYNPFETELIHEAKKKGLITSHGLSMLIEQALLAEDIWLESSHTREESEELIAEIYSKTSNLVLFGMPSCGKSTLGKIVAEKLKREFVDTDTLITEKTGKTPSEIIKESGEKAFRDIESKVINSVAKESGKVISVGGGGVLRSENVKALHSNGVMIYIKRPLALLSSEDRPLSQNKGIDKLYEERKDIYEGAKDSFVLNDKTTDYAVKEILKEYEIACNKRC